MVLFYPVQGEASGFFIVMSWLAWQRALYFHKMGLVLMAPHSILKGPALG